MKLWKCCLLVLLCVALPVQAVLAAVHGGCLVHTQHASTGQVDRVAAPARAPDHAQADTGCPHHRAGAEDPSANSPSPETDCSHCSSCCPGSAPPSTTASWQGPQKQRSTLQQTTPAHPSLPMAALERPPRAPTPVVFKG